MAASPFAVLERTVPRRIIFGLLFAVAFGAMVVVAQNGETGGSAPSGRDDAIEALIPSPGSDILRQSEVGIDLVEGYMATLVVNGVEIPESQLRGIPEDERMPALGRYVFAPGPGQVLESLNSGPNCVTATYWKASEGPAQASVERWCFSAA